MSQFSAWREKFSTKRTDGESTHWNAEAKSESRQSSDVDSEDAALSSGIVLRIRTRVQRVLNWRPSTHLTAETRIERLRTLERRRRN